MRCEGVWNGPVFMGKVKQIRRMQIKDGYAERNHVNAKKNGVSNNRHERAPA